MKVINEDWLFWVFLALFVFAGIGLISTIICIINLLL